MYMKIFSKNIWFVFVASGGEICMWIMWSSHAYIHTHTYVLRICALNSKLVDKFLCWDQYITDRPKTLSVHSPQTTSPSIIHQQVNPSIRHSVIPSTTQPIIHIKSHYENQLIGFRFVVVVAVVVASQVSSFLCSVFLFGHSGCAATRVVSFRKSFGMLNASRTFTFLIQSVIGIRSSVRPG